MLEQYFTRPQTVDAIRASWIGEPIERYVDWLHSHGYAHRSIVGRVQLLRRFGEFATARGAQSWEELPSHVEAFGRPHAERRQKNSPQARFSNHRRKEIQPVEQMLELILPDFQRATARPEPTQPFASQAPDFFTYLSSERGLKDATLIHYRAFLNRFERYLVVQRVRDLRRLRPRTLSDFIQEASGSLSHTSMAGLCDALRVFLRYLHREQVTQRDLSQAVERPRIYQFAHIPRAIEWEDSVRLLRQIDRRSISGRRDYAMLLLLVTYGLRAREVAALTLDDIKWRSGTLRVPLRKGGHSTQYRLSDSAGDALSAYIESGRPTTDSRLVFFTTTAPHHPLERHNVSQRTTYWLKQAGIQVPRPGSHTLRHTVAQHLLDSDFSLKEIGDYIGHRSPLSTQIYAKVDLSRLRDVALGCGEEALS
jgi:site-specific recombinase XerD